MMEETEEEEEESLHSDVESLEQKDDEAPEQKVEEEVVVEEDVDPRDLLTKEQVDYWKSVFNEFDPQKKQKVPVKTVGTALRLMGLNPTKAQIKNHIQEVDPFKQGMIDFQSFLLPIAQRINDVPENHEQIIEAFRILEEGDHNYISTNELTEYLTSYGEDLEDFELEALFKLADPKGTKKLYYVEFVEKLMGVAKKPKGKKDKKKKKK